jgi:hypothetical protein
MEDVAKRIVDGLEPADGWWKSDAEEKLLEVTLTMLEDMDEDTVEECVGTIAGVMRSEYGE